MYLSIIILGAICGIFLFALKSEFLVGAITGGALAFLLTKILLMGDKITALENKLKKQRHKETVPPVSASKQKTCKVKVRTPAEVFASTTVDSMKEVAKKSKVDQPVKESISPQATFELHEPTPPPVSKWKKHQTDLWNIIVSYFTGGNVVVRVGVIILFFGVAFLLKYTAERNVVPIEFRLIGVSVGAIAILAIGWRLRLSRPGYALVLQGGGVGGLYLTIFAAIRLYHVLPASISMALLVFLSIFSAGLAILQDARSLAVIGILGGFLAPVLTSTGSGNHIMLFSYYAFLNIGILFTARFKSWRELNLIGFVFTFGIGTIWGTQNYHHDLFATTEPFLVLFFIFYVLIGILFANNQPLKLKGYVDNTMVFGTPLVCFGLQTCMVKHFEYGIAWSALAMGALYSSLAWMVFKKGSESMRTLIESFLAMGVVFGTIAIPLALDGKWTSAAWALEGSAILWIAIKQQRWMARIFGMVLQFFAGIAFLTTVKGPPANLGVLNGFFFGCLAVSFAGFFSSYYLLKHHEKIPSASTEGHLAFGWALLWWLGAGYHEIDIFVNSNYQLTAGISFFSFTSLISYIIGDKLDWKLLRQVYKALIIVMIVGCSKLMQQFNSHPSIYGGYIAWPMSFLVNYGLLHQDDSHSKADHIRYLHIGSFLLTIILTTWEASWWVDFLTRGQGVWGLVCLGAIPAAFVYLLSKLHNRLPWPVKKFHDVYLYHALSPVVLIIWAGTVIANITSKGEPAPLSYIPFLNPFDLTQFFILFTISFWLIVIKRQQGCYPFGLDSKKLIAIVGATIFLWFNAILIRTIHYWGGVSFGFEAMIRSDLVQTSLSIFWTLSAFGVMSWATKKKIRLVWLVGAGLIGIVIIKLFTFDLTNTGTVERIVSFIGVGLICLIIGYFAPLPASKKAEFQKP